MSARNSLLALLLFTLTVPHALLAQTDTAQANRAKRELKRAEAPDTVVVEALPVADRIILAVMDFDSSTPSGIARPPTSADSLRRFSRAGRPSRP